MKISIVVGGRFHAFDLAQYLNEKQVLETLITSYPKFYIKKNYKKINLEKVQSIISKELINRSFGKIDFLNSLFNINDFSSKYFRKRASELISYDEIDILLGWSGFSLESFKRAMNFNCLKVLERGSSHILHQYEILKEEYNLIGLKPLLPTKKNIDIEKQEYEIADHIMVPSQFAKDTFIKRGFHFSRVSKVPYGVDLKMFKTNNKKLHDKDPEFRIIYTGSLSVRKGIIYLLGAFCELNLKNSELILVGNIENNIKKKISKFLDHENVTYHPAKNQSELNDYYVNSDLFITCSIEEGLSMVQVQAMACGLALISTENSGGRELIEEGYNGYIAPIRNIEYLKNKILYLYNNRDELREMGKNSQKKALSFFSWDNYGSEVLKTHDLILKK